MSIIDALSASLVACGAALTYILETARWWPLVFVAAFCFYRRDKRFGTLSLGCAGAALALLSVSPSAVAKAQPEQTTYTLEGEMWREVKSLSVINAAGDIEVIASENPRTEITYRKLEPNALHTEPQVVVGEEGLELTVINPAWPNEQKQNLAADITLYLAPDTDLTIRVNSGNIRLENIRNVKLTTDVGDIYVLGSEAADVQSYAGDVTLEQVTGAAHVSSSAGSLSLDFAQPPSGPISAKTGAGDVSLSLPRGSDVSIIAVSESRDLSGDFGELLSPDEGRARLGQGWHEVDLSSSAGEVSFRLKGN